MRRIAKPGEIRANLTLGAVAVPLALDHPAAGVAVAALAACGLDFGGVDMIEDGDGVLRVLEVDAWAGFAGITRVTRADVAGAILDFAAAPARRAEGSPG
jgi:ribosomal protein S6--L-glutamate ligase